MKFARIGVAASMALLCALAIGPAAATAATTHAWAQGGFDAGNTGFNPNETIINPTNITNGLSWQWGILSPVVEDPCRGQFAPVVAGGRLFLADQGGFAAYNAAAGNRLWTVRLGISEDVFISAMAVSGTTLLVAVIEGCHSVSDPDGTLRAYNVATGALLWSVFRDAPAYQVMTDQGVVVGVGGDAAANEATAYRVSDGTQLWDRFNVSADAPVSAGGRVLLTGDLDFHGNPTSTFAVNLSTGATLWSKPVAWYAAAATPDGTRFVVRTLTGDLMEVSAAAGAIAWTQPGAAGSLPLKLAVDTTQVYVVNGSQLSSYLSSNGTPGWQRNLFTPIGRPVVANDILYITAGGELDVMNKDNGIPFGFEFGFSQGYIDHAVVENGRLYATTGRVLDAYAP